MKARKMNQIPYLVVRTDKGSSHLNLVGSNAWKIGRAKNNDFVITDQWISRTHAALIQFTSGKNFYLIDWGSRNGTFVNEDIITVTTVLKQGDRIALGKTKLDFHYPQKEPQIKEKIVGEYDRPTSTLHVRGLITTIAIEIHEYTSLAMKLDDSIFVSLISDWFRKIAGIISNYGGCENKFFGGVTLAFWIAKQNKIDREELINILSCIKAISRVTRELNVRYTLPFALKISVAVKTGYVMLGNLGGSERSDYTAAGDTVNLALALLSAAKNHNLDLALSENTFRYLIETENTQNYIDIDRFSLEGYSSAIGKIKFEDLKQFRSHYSLKTEI